MPSESKFAGEQVFLFGHQDDEFAVFGHLERLVAQGCPVRCVYLTDGSARSAGPTARNDESSGVLASMGIPPGQISFTGTSEGLRDGYLHQGMDRAYASLSRLLAAAPVAALYLPAWEGGHHDHDNAHLIGAEVGRSLRGAELLQYSLYNGATTRGAWFSVVRPIPANGPVTRTGFTIAASLRFIRRCFSYRSQWRTWIGLLPFFAVRVLFERSMALQPCRLERLVERPHPGPLYYERRFHVPYETIAAAGAALRERHS